MTYPHFREDTNDQHIWDNIITNNEYHLPDSLEKWVVIDVGAHIGAFTVACLERGAHWVWAYEPDRESALFFLENTAPYSNRSHLTIAAAYNPVMESSRKLGLSKRTDIAGRINSGSRSLLCGEVDYEVPIISFDDALEQVYHDNFPHRKILVKLDCEGSEWPILLFSQQIHLANTIIGEWHGFELNRRVRNKSQYSAKDLEIYFTNRGFSIETTYHDRHDALGMFFASR